MPPPLASAGGALRYDPSGAYMASIQAAKGRASAGLMQVMMEEMGLLGWLTSLKRFFLLEQVGVEGRESVRHASTGWCSK